MFLGHSKNRFNKSYEALSEADIFDESPPLDEKTIEKCYAPERLSHDTAGSAALRRGFSPASLCAPSTKFS